MHEGHRKRIIERLMTDGERMQDHELLEVLLFNAIPRKNTNPIAHELLLRFGTLSGVFQADIAQLKSVEGVGQSTAAYLKSIGLIMDRARGESSELPKVTNFAQLTQFLSERFRGLENEHLEVYCIDGSARVRYSKSYTSSEALKVRMKPDDVVQFIVAHNARGLVVAHNHPDGCLRPSVEDDAFTAQLLAFCTINNVRFYDHVIVAGERFYSYHVERRLEKVAGEFDFNKLVKETLQ